MQKKQLLDDDKVGRLLLKLSLPAITGMLVMALYNIVDTIFVGKGVGSFAIGALSLAFPIQMIFMGIAQMIGIGGASLLSRSLGENNLPKAAVTMGNAVLLALITGFTVTGLGWILKTDMLRLLGTTETLWKAADSYISVILLGVPIQSMAMTLNNMVRAEGRANVAMTTMIIGALANIVLDALFIFKFGWGIGGAAWATVISQVFTTGFLVHFVWSRRSIVTPSGSDYRPSVPILQDILSVGIATFARHSAMSVLAALVNRTLADLGGDTAIAAYGIVFRVLMFVFMPMMGIAQGMQPIVGFNYGARRLGRLKHTVKLAMGVATAFSVLGTLVLMAIPEPVFRLFTNDEALIAAGCLAMGWVIVAFPVVGFQIVGATLFQALGRALPNFFLSLSRQVLFLIPMVLILPRYFHIQGVWMAFPAADILSAVLTAVLLLRLRSEWRSMNNQGGWT